MINKITSESNKCDQRMSFVCLCDEDNNKQEPEKWLCLNQTSKICTHTKTLQHIINKGCSELLISCEKCKTAWELNGDE